MQAVLCAAWRAALRWDGLSVPVLTLPSLEVVWQCVTLSCCPPPQCMERCLRPRGADPECDGRRSAALGPSPALGASLP